MNRLRQIVIVVACLWVLSPLAIASPARTYKIDPTYSNVGFSIYKWTVFKEEGLFHEFDGEVTYNPADPARSHVNMTVNVGSIDTRQSGRDKVVRSEDFFDTDRYPTMTFSSTAVAPGPDNTLQVTGDLTIRGVTRRITIPVKMLGRNTVPNVGELAGFETSFVIDRTDFGVNGTRWSGGKLVLSKEVAIHLTIGAMNK